MKFSNLSIDEAYKIMELPPAFEWDEDLGIHFGYKGPGCLNYHGKEDRIKWIKLKEQYQLEDEIRSLIEWCDNITKLQEMLKSKEIHFENKSDNTYFSLRLHGLTYRRAIGVICYCKPLITETELEECKSRDIIFAKPRGYSEFYDFIDETVYYLDAYCYAGSADDAGTECSVYWDKKNDMNVNLVGVVCEAAGKVHYKFVENHQTKLTIDFESASQDCLIRVNGYGHELEMNEDMEATLFPGIKRFFKDKAGIIYGAYECKYGNAMNILYDSQVLNVKFDDKNISVYDGDALVAHIKLHDESKAKSYTESGFECKKIHWFDVNMDVSEELYPLILSLPVLKF